MIALIALMLAWNDENKVLDLVAYAWAGFGAAFGPAILFSLFWKRMTGAGALAGMIFGGLTVILWKYTGSNLYEIVPGFIFSSIGIVLFILVSPRPPAEVEAEFERAQKPMES